MKIDKIQLHNFRFFIDEEEHNTFELNGQNMLLYGENGSGKSSLFKAFEFLAKQTLSSKEFEQSINIFKQDNTYLKFEFDNRETLKIDKEHLNFESEFIKNFSLANPLLDYKKLLYINFSTNPDYKRINIYPVLEKLFENYPIDLDTQTVLKDITNPNEKLEKIKDIIDNIKDDINLFLTQFTNEFYIDKFIYTTDYIPITKSLGLNNILEFVVNIDISFHDKKIKEYQNFLNEARLSALAISIYFAVIKHISSLDNEDSLKILVLDDVLISLDMSNRFNLIDIIKTEFSDFQIFFFTHDKGFFEILKDKMSWKAYEIYVDNEGEFEKPYLKTDQTYHEKAIEYFRKKEYEIASNFLRKEVEKQLYDYLGLKTLDGMLSTAKIKDNYKKLEKCFEPLIIVLKGFDNCEHIPDDKKVEKCIEFAQKVKEALISLENIFKEDNFHNINSIKDRILNPQSHYDNSKPLYKKELEDAIELIEKGI